MARNNIEIEIQVKIENSIPLMEFLSEKGDFQSEERQVDEYFSPTHSDFLAQRPVREWLRIRDAGNDHVVCYKNWHFDENGKSRYCDEYETAVEDGGKLRKIFLSLGFRPIVTVDKARKTWTFKDYEIAVDSVKGLGDFVEIEYIGEDEVDPVFVTDEMVKFLKEMGCGRISRNHVGYPFPFTLPERERTGGKLNKKKSGEENLSALFLLTESISSA